MNHLSSRIYNHTNNSSTRAQPTAVILGGGRTALNMVRSLALANLRSIVVSSDGDGNEDDVATVSRYAHHFPVKSFCGEEFIDSLLCLRSKTAQNPVLLFSDDRPLMTVSHYRDRLAGQFYFQLPPHELLGKMALKQPFFEIAQRGGFPVPATCLLHNYGDLNQIHNLRPPICVKPNGRSAAYDRQFKKAYRLERHAEVRTLCETILPVAGEVIVQEWIEGSNDSIYFTLCCMSDPEPAVFTGQKGRSWPPQIGVTASCWAAPPEVAAELEDITVRFFREISFEAGLASMEFKRDQRDGRFLMVEPTLGRADLQEELSALCGVNLPYIAYCSAAGLPRPELNLNPAHVWRDEFRDQAAAWILGSKCSYPPHYQIHNAYWRWDDPAPAIRAITGYLRRAIRRMNKLGSGLAN